MNRLDFFKARLEANLSPMEYVRAVKEEPDKYLLLDVRVGPSVTEKIQGALSIPLDQLKERLHELPKDKTIIAYCWDTWCTLAAKAAVILLENGYDAKELYGGLAAWKSMKFPVSLLGSDTEHSLTCEC